MAHQILVVDDDPHICEVICFALEKAGMSTVTASNGADALAAFTRVEPDLVILDVGMPDMDGLEVCRCIRKSADTPIVFLSARDEEIDRILGLEIGGDDYVTKPFSPRELVARVNVILKRAQRASAASEPAQSLLEHGGVSLDLDRHAAAYDGTDITLTAVEFGLLKALIARPGVVMTRDQLITAAYSANMHISDRTIDSHVRNIRAKFAGAGCASVIDTVHGVGFRLGACAHAP